MVAAQPATEPIDTTATYQGKKISIILKNGMVFNGTVISDNGRMLLLDRDGSPVNLYKSTIARIEIEGVTDVQNGVLDSVKTDDTISQNEIAAKVAKPLFTVSKFEDESGSVSHLSTDESKQAVTSKLPAKVIEEKKTGTFAAVSVSQADTTFVKTVQNRQPHDSTKIKANSRVVGTRPEAPKLVSISARESPDIPENLYFPSVAKTNDGKQTIVLKNGTVFTGVIQSEDGRFIIINSEGTPLNILKKVIKTIDGQAYRVTAPVKTPTATEVPQNIEPKAQKVTKPVKRPQPSVAVSQEISTEMLLDSLKSPLWEQKSRACRMLGTMGDWAYSAIPAIAQLLSDTAQSKTVVPVWIDSSDVQRLLAPSLEAARALSFLGENGYQTLVNGLSSSDVLVRRSAVFGLHEFSGDKAKTEILFKMLKDKDVSVRAVALGAFATENGERLLIDALRDSETVIRCNAALLLGKMKSERAVNELENLLSDNRSFVRVHAVKAIGEIGSANSSAKIVHLLKDPNFIVREKTAEALGRLGDTVSIVPLINALKDVNPDVRGTAATALSYIRDPRAIPSLYSLLKDENLAVREKVRHSLRLHTELKQLIDGLDDPSTTVRENSSYVLWLLTGKDFGNDPEKWKKWYVGQRKKKNALK
ncbi:MAG: HEAT repeat domain-containing protein [Chitinispirillaceae bacterium]|nr:HEAT repeat domain-containing protein [Chitinispirillaceae bacterium]